MHGPPLEAGPAVGREGGFVVALDVQLDVHDAASGEVGQAEPGQRAGEPPAVQVGVDADDVDLAGAPAGRVDLGPVKSGETARVVVLEEDEPLGVEPGLSGPLGETVGVETPLLGVVGEGRRVDGQECGVYLLYTSPSARDAHESRMPSSA